MGISEASWDGSASRFTDEQYQASCVLDRKVCGGDWASKPPKERCSLPIKEPGGALSRAGVHAAAARIGQVTNACPAALAAAKAKLRSAYKQLGEDAPSSLGGSSSDDDKSKSGEDTQFNHTMHRDRALAALEDGVWEFRSENAKKGTLGTLAGYFAVFNRWTEIDSPFEGRFMERVMPGAFTKTFNENQKGMRVLLNHGKDPSVGMKPLGPIRDLSQDDHGAYYEVDLLDTSYNRDIVPGLEAGQYGASFRFQVMREEYQPKPMRAAHNPNGIPESSITEAKVREFGPVTFPAYADATASLRSINDELQMLDLRLFAASDPQGVARFAQIITRGIPDLGEAVEAAEAEAAERGANVGTTEAEAGDTTPSEAGEERNAPTDADWSIAFGLKEVKKELAGVKAKQLADPDHGTDPDDKEVMDCIEAAEAAIDKAIVAQAKDGRDDNNSSSNGLSDAPRDAEESSDETNREEQGSHSVPAPGTIPSPTPNAPASRAPVRSKNAPGATLVKRAAPLFKPNEGAPKWKV